jgi:hypothetical protein
MAGNFFKNITGVQIKSSDTREKEEKTPTDQQQAKARAVDKDIMRL